MISLLTAQYKPYLYAAALIALVCALSLAGYKGYSMGHAVAEAACASAQERQREADAVESKRQRDGFQKRGKELEHEIENLRSRKPAIRYVPNRMCSGPDSSVSAASGEPDAEDAARQAAAIGEALAHDADHYPECVARLDALIDAESAR